MLKDEKVFKKLSLNSIYPSYFSIHTHFIHKFIKDECSVCKIIFQLEIKESKRAIQDILDFVCYADWKSNPVVIDELSNNKRDKYAQDFKYCPGCSWLSMVISCNNLDTQKFNDCLQSVALRENCEIHELSWKQVIKNKDVLYSKLNEALNRNGSFDAEKIMEDLKNIKINRLDETSEVSDSSCEIIEIPCDSINRVQNSKSIGKIHNNNTQNNRKQVKNEKDDSPQKYKKKKSSQRFQKRKVYQRYKKDGKTFFRRVSNSLGKVSIVIIIFLFHIMNHIEFNEFRRIATRYCVNRIVILDKNITFELMIWRGNIAHYCIPLVVALITFKWFVRKITRFTLITFEWLSYERIKFALITLEWLLYEKIKFRLIRFEWLLYEKIEFALLTFKWLFDKLIIFTLITFEWFFFHTDHI